MTDPDCLNEDWGNFYHTCPRWWDTWVATHHPKMAWPKGIKMHKDRMYLNEKLCVPLQLQSLWIRENHTHMGHPGPEKLWQMLKTKVEWAREGDAKYFVNLVMSQCETCQACQRPLNLKRPLVHTPIPPKIMSSVAMDIFFMPLTTLRKKKYDALVVCVDRHSGWIVAVRCERKGLTGARVAKKCCSTNGKSLESRT